MIALLLQQLLKVSILMLIVPKNVLFVILKGRVIQQESHELADFHVLAHSPLTAGESQEPGNSS